LNLKKTRKRKRPNAYFVPLSHKIRKPHPKKREIPADERGILFVPFSFAMPG